MQELIKEYKMSKNEKIKYTKGAEVKFLNPSRLLQIAVIEKAGFVAEKAAPVVVKKEGK